MLNQSSDMLRMKETITKRVSSMIKNLLKYNFMFSLSLMTNMSETSSRSIFPMENPVMPIPYTSRIGSASNKKVKSLLSMPMIRRECYFSQIPFAR